jgi:hypothetical protein
MSVDTYGDKSASTWVVWLGIAEAWINYNQVRSYALRGSVVGWFHHPTTPPSLSQLRKTYKLCCPAVQICL